MRTLIVFYSNVTAALVRRVPHDRIIVLVNADYLSGWTDLIGSDPDRLIPIHVDRDANDPVPWYEEVSNRIQQERAAGHDVEVDLTAGKKPMSLGAYAAAEFHSVRSTYLKHVVPGPRREPATAPQFEIKEPVNVVSIRDELGLDWLTSADNAFRLGRFDTASELYERAAKANAPGADVLVAVSKARQAWLEGHYVIAHDSWPSKAGRLPQHWLLVANALSSFREQGLEHPFELDESPFALWLRDRAFALELRRRGSHALTDVARVAWLLIEELLKRVLRDRMSQGHQLKDNGRRRPSKTLRKLTLGPLLGLVCDSKSGRWELTSSSASAKDPLVIPCQKLRGRPLPGTENAEVPRYEGLEVRNRLAHGGATAEDVKKWVEVALAQHGPLDQLIQACMPPGVNAPAPSPLEDPEQIRRQLAS